MFQLILAVTSIGDNDLYTGQENNEKNMIKAKTRFKGRRSTEYI